MAVAMWRSITASLKSERSFALSPIPRPHSHRAEQASKRALARGGPAGATFATTALENSAASKERFFGAQVATASRARASPDLIIRYIYRRI
jgi:hypothetical protein